MVNLKLKIIENIKKPLTEEGMVRGTITEVIN